CGDKGAFWTVTFKNDLTVPVPGAALGTHQIIASVLFIEVGCLDPNGFLGEVDPTVHNDFIRIWNYPVPFQVIFPDLDDPMPIIEFLARVRGIVVHHIGLSIIVNEKGGIYSIEVQFYGIAPTLPRVFGLNDNVSKSTTNMGGDHIEGVVMGIVGDPRSVYTLADPDLLHLQLGASLQDMADLGPVHQIPGM